MDGVKVAEMSQLPFAKNNKKYQSLNDKIAKLNQEIEQIQQDINDYPSDKQSAKLLNQKFQKRYQYQKKLEEQQKASWEPQSVLLKPTRNKSTKDYKKPRRHLMTVVWIWQIVCWAKSKMMLKATSRG